MAKRPVFSPQFNGYPFVVEIIIEFDWYPGFAKTQSQKSILSLHNAAARKGIAPILEISSKSLNPLGVSLSALNLILIASGKQMSVECAYQGSKIFKGGGPFTDLYTVSSIEAKTDERLRNSGELIAFNFLGEDFPTKPMNAFYDWLYIVALSQNPAQADKLTNFRGFSDIAHNPKKSINCQAHSAALFVALSKFGEIERIVKDKSYYLNLITGVEVQPDGKTTKQLKFRL